MQIMDLLNTDDIALDVDVRGKSAVLDALAATLSRRTGLAKDRLLTALNARERLGSTAINHGVAIPHAHLDDLTKHAAAFARLAQPVDFGAQDGGLVDVVFAFIWPTHCKDGFLQHLAPMCRLLRQPALLAKLRQATHADEIGQCLDAAHEQAPPPRQGTRSFGQLRA
ncbi:PTS sugar transporter subunit IIA [Chelatococcus asaccharovorans]|uniref:PTS system nitrogen regulatory IIA component n=1 Tax=Chelatococcus asaccharovorans TaxID=28210 RepID=A0A2V3UUS6_9HYPH|nr:PTS sugar transporter subunit IIA [Chelatococcus asaccharovorans]MBS7701814.1 PTS sugar transporter subunit IIA [Chelatococcus asaccharovorans]PXW64478.1 PTS system nitrogen regulatory IIA component [Chelatococcus asaccharovorans]